MVIIGKFKIIVTIAAIISTSLIAVGANVKAQPDELSLTEARQYMLKLINNDRKANGQRPVELDAVSTLSGQQHSNDMAENGYLSHWDLAGTKPDQRYTLVGGQATVAENCYILSYADSPQQQKLAQPQTFSKSEIEEAEQAFMNEIPPNDGHRKNILDPNHTGVGIGISASGDDRNRRLALTQEFVDNYGGFAPLPQRIRAGDAVSVSGQLHPGINIYSVDVRWEQLPSPMTLKQLKETYSYGAPEERVATIWPAHPRRPGIVVNPMANGTEFSASVSTDSNWRPGLYYVFVWATKDGAQRPIVVSRRTFELH